MADLTTDAFRGLPREALKLALQREARAIGILEPEASDSGRTVEMYSPIAPRKHLRPGRFASLLYLLGRPWRNVTCRVGQHCHWRESTKAQTL